MSTDKNRLYQKCKHCHLFVEDEAETDAPEPLFVHLTRGDEPDERFEDHQPEASGMVANLKTWRVFGPSMMRERFVSHLED